MPIVPSDIIKDLKAVIDGAFTHAAFGLFCRTFVDDSLSVRFDDFRRLNATEAEHLMEFILALRDKRKLGAFIEILIREKGRGFPDVLQLKKNWDHLLEKNAEGLDAFRSDAFDLIFFQDNNEDLPFIDREAFKEHIRLAVNSRPQGGLRLVVNGVKGVGISYLKEYLTHLDKRFNCLKKYLIIDCNEDLMKDPNDEIHPVHIAESMLYKLDIEPPSYIDVEDPSKFKERYFSRFFDEVKKKCEEDGEPFVLFIDHLRHEMHPSVFSFFDKFLDKLKQFRVSYMVILGGMTVDHINLSAEVRELTLEPFKAQDLKRFFAKLYRFLEPKYPQRLQGMTGEVFVEQCLEAFAADTANDAGAPVAETQKKVKIWYEELLSELKGNS